jgi:hypothetical protein
MYNQIMNSRRGSILIVLILVVAAVVVAGAYLLGKQGVGISVLPQPTITTGTPKPPSSSNPSPQENQTTSPKPTTSTQYSVPSNWKKINCTDVGLSLSIPPDWKVSDQGCWLTYWRDAGFAPSRGNIMRVAFKGGSRRDQYIERFNDYGDVKDELVANTLVTEKSINGLDTLLLVPKDPGNHVSVSPAFIFVRNNWLYIFEMAKGEGGNLNFWNDSSFMKPYYRIIASFKFIN